MPSVPLSLANASARPQQPAPTAHRLLSPATPPIDRPPLGSRQCSISSKVFNFHIIHTAAQANNEGRKPKMCAKAKAVG